jgi:glucose-1-phosphate thymidylyltransferase
MSRGHRARAEPLESWWIHTGRVTPLLDANRTSPETPETRVDGDVDELTQLDDRVVIEAGAIVRSSRIRGPVAIAASATIENSSLGPFTAVGERCRISDSEIEHTRS